MERLIVRANRNHSGSGPLVQVTPEIAGWTYIGFEVYRLQAGESFGVSTEGRETAVIVLEGTCDIVIGDVRFEEVGSRQSVFDDASPEVVYSPPGPNLHVTAVTRSEVAVASAIADHGVGEPRRISSVDIPYERRGSGSTERYIRHILDEHHPASKLLLVEVVTPPGNWSSFPPHKHDEEIPRQEAYLEETYYYRMSPDHGQAMQRVYDKRDLDAVLTPRDGDVVLVPRGYHPVASPPGFTSYYLNVMAGHNRVWKYALDPDYAHIAPKDGNIMGTLERRDGK